MNQKNNEKFILFVSTFGSIGLILENILMGWEFWVVPVCIAGIAFLWGLSLSSRVDFALRKMFYFTISVLIFFYHGIHKSSLFDAALSATLIMVTFSLFNQIYMMNTMLLAYFSVLFIHFINLPGGDPVPTDKLTISRIILHIAIVFLVYYFCAKSIDDRLDEEKKNKIRIERTEANDSNMEDFLSNISHELRTPVNVVNGMSDLLIKQGVGYEADAIKNAAVRLAYQIEDIQDYTECRRNSIFIEEDDYMSTSLINDVVTFFRMNDNTADLELVVDLDPKVPTMMRGDIKKLHKVFRHLLENAIKFTKVGGIFVRMFAEDTDYGVNLGIEITDTGIGMDLTALTAITEGMYQANKKRNRSSGGIGLGLFIVYGFAHAMGGFVKIESEKRKGTTIRVTVPQKVVNSEPCLELEDSFEGAVLFHVRPDKYKIPRVRDFNRDMAANLAAGIHVPLYAAETVYDVERLKEKFNATHVFMGQEEYEENRGYFDMLSKEDIVVVVSAESGLEISKDSRVVIMPKPLYAYPIMKILNEGRGAKDLDYDHPQERPVFEGVRALVVDDEPMNLVVARSLLRDYKMVVETADGGKDAIFKCHDNQYDLVFMDHMMPDMDGVEAMKKIKTLEVDLGRKIPVIALTANAVSGAREMFIQEGFDGFIAKPINTSDLERVVQRVLTGGAS